MNCKQFTTWWNEWRDGTLAPDRARLMDRHLADCAGCRRHHRRMQRMLERLARWPAPEQAPAGLTRRLVARAAGVQPRRNLPRLYAVAATLLVGFVGGLLVWPALDALSPGKPASGPAARVSLALMQTETVRVAINAKRPVDNAVMTVELPPGVEIAGYPGQRRLHWQTDLKTGRNELTLPLTASEAVSGGLVKTRIEYEGRRKELSILVDTDRRAERSGDFSRSITTALLAVPVAHPQPRPIPLIRPHRRYTV